MWIILRHQLNRAAVQGLSGGRKRRHCRQTSEVLRRRSRHCPSRCSFKGPYQHCTPFSLHSMQGFTLTAFVCHAESQQISTDPENILIRSITSSTTKAFIKGSNKKQPEKNKRPAEENGASAAPKRSRDEAGPSGSHEHSCGHGASTFRY